MKEIYNERETDYNYKREQELYGGKSAEEMKQLVEEFERKINVKKN